MREIAVDEAKTRLSELLLEVERGEQVTITRREQPVARLVRAATDTGDADGQRERVGVTIASLLAQRKGVVLEGDLHALIADVRD